MYISFDQLSNQAPIWVYQADVALNEEYGKMLMQKVKAFLENWTSHGRPLSASAMLYEHRFLILGIEKSTHELSCCTVDSAIQLLRDIKATLQIDFLKRNRICLKQDGQIFAIPIQEVKRRFAQGEIPPDTLMFDNTIMYKESLSHKWLIPIQDSWLGK